MFKTEKVDYGVKLTFGGFIKKEEMAQWVLEAEKIISLLPSKFGVFVDMRDLKPLPHDAELEMQKGQKLFKQKGMERSVVILSNAVTTMQFKRIAQETGIYQWERYIDASKTTNWEESGKKWLVSSIDPDK
jgi:hypothetical protein